MLTSTHYRKFLATLVVALTAAFTVACSHGDHAAKHHHAHKADIVDTAVQAGSFNTLVAAVQAAGLADTLKSDGPFTVFAPTDAAFAKLPAGTIDSLLKPENRDQLRAILLYHVVPGRVPAEKVVASRSLTTAQGAALTVRQAGGNVTINNATVTATDIDTSNGVIHVIDTVVIPKS